MRVLDVFSRLRLDCIKQSLRRYVVRLPLATRTLETLTHSNPYLILYVTLHRCYVGGARILFFLFCVICSFCSGIRLPSETEPYADKAKWMQARGTSMMLKLSFIFAGLLIE